MFVGEESDIEGYRRDAVREGGDCWVNRGTVNTGFVLTSSMSPHFMVGFN